MDKTTIMEMIRKLKLAEKRQSDVLDATRRQLAEMQALLEVPKK